MNQVKKIISLAIAVFAVFMLTYICFNTVEHIDAGEILVVQSPRGKMSVYSTPGYHAQWFGKTTIYTKRSQFWFDKAHSSGKEDESMRIRFNDGAHATISGSVAWEMPLDEKSVLELHSRYGTQQAVEHQLIDTVLEKSVYMTGPLMSSAESYATKRTDLLSLIVDQAERGVYRTDTREVRQKDAFTDLDKIVKIVEPQKGPDGKILREGESPISEFGIKLYNLSINEVRYDPQVEEQIQKQQQSVMAIQTAIAQSKTAEQNALTSEKEGQAAAAKAKWEQEVKKATDVTKAQQEAEVAQIMANREKTNALIKASQEFEVAKITAERERTNALIRAQQELDVAILAVKAAEAKKQQDTLLGEGEAARRKLVMEADGALEKKLEAWVSVNGKYADAIKGYGGAWVPSVVMGGAGNGGAIGAAPAGGAMDLVQLLTAKTATDLALEVKNFEIQRSKTNSVSVAQK